MFQFTHPLDYKSLGYHKPGRWSYFYNPGNYPDQRMWSKHYERVTPRNTITIHVSGVECDEPCSRWVSFRGLEELIRLPAGVVRTSDKANRYPFANLFRSYSIFGRVAPGARSELDIERGQKPEPDEERDLRKLINLLGGMP